MGFWDAVASAGPYANNLHLAVDTSTPHHSIFTGRTLFLMPSQQCQSTEGKHGTATNQQADPVCYHQSESGWCGEHGVVVGWSLVDRLALEASYH